jgi:hypothetical protein
MKKATQLKALLGILAMTGFAAFAPMSNSAPAAAAPAPALGNVLGNAKLSPVPSGQSLKVNRELGSSLQTVNGLRKKVNVTCDGGGSQNGGGC